MNKVTVADLPWVVRIVLGLAALNVWASFEELVIDRLGIWRYLPGYRYGRECVWDWMVAIGIAGTIWWLSTSKRARQP